MSVLPEGTTIADLDAMLVQLGEIPSTHKEPVIIEWLMDRPLTPQDVRSLIAANKADPYSLDLSCRMETLQAASAQLAMQAESFALCARALRLHDLSLLGTADAPKGSGIAEARRLVSLSRRLVHIAETMPEAAAIRLQDIELADAFSQAGKACIAAQAELDDYRLTTFGEALAKRIVALAGSIPEPKKEAVAS